MKNLKKDSYKRAPVVYWIQQFDRKLLKLAIWHLHPYKLYTHITAGLPPPAPPIIQHPSSASSIKQKKKTLFLTSPGYSPILEHHHPLAILHNWSRLYHNHLQPHTSNSLHLPQHCRSPTLSGTHSSLTRHFPLHSTFHTDSPNHHYNLLHHLLSKLPLTSKLTSPSPITHHYHPWNQPLAINNKASLNNLTTIVESQNPSPSLPPPSLTVPSPPLSHFYRRTSKKSTLTNSEPELRNQEETAKMKK